MRTTAEVCNTTAWGDHSVGGQSLSFGVISPLVLFQVKQAFIQDTKYRRDNSRKLGRGRPAWKTVRLKSQAQSLTRVRLSGAARDFSPRVNFQCRLSHGVRTDPVCKRMNQRMCAR